MTMKINTIGITIALASVLIASKLTGQDQLPKVKEFGIGLTNFNSFSLQYRWGNEKRLFRISGNIGGTTSNGNSSDKSTTIQDTINNGSSSTAKTTSPINLNCGLSFSILKIKSVSEKLGFVYGGISSFAYAISQTNTNKNSIQQGNTYPNNSNSINTTTSKISSQTFQPSIGMALGVVYKINSSFLLYAEIDPNLYYAYQKTTSITTNEITSTTYNYLQTDNVPGSTNTFGIANLTNSGASLTIVYRITN